MTVPSSSQFTPIDLENRFNQNRSILPDTLVGLDTLNDIVSLYEAQSLHGIPFALGQQAAPNVILLDQEAIDVPCVDDAGQAHTATYIVFLHVVEDRITNYQDGFADFAVDGNELGQHVSDYTLTYVDGSQHTTPIRRRFAIQQTHIQWGASAFEALPALKPDVFPSATEANALERLTWYDYGKGETRHLAGRERSNQQLWLYALPNPHPEKPIQSITCTPKEERSVIYGISTTMLADHPLRPGTRKKLQLTLPEGLALNAIKELEPPDIDIDLGTVISARAMLEYDRNQWLGDVTTVQPTQSTNRVVVEYAAHPAANLYLSTGEVYALSELSGGDSVAAVGEANRPVTIKVVEQGSTTPVPVRFHMHGEAGEYLPPKNQHRRVNPHWFEDNYGEFVNGRNHYAYIPGHCDMDLPLGNVYVEITRGYEIEPLRTVVEITPETEELTFEIKRVLDWRARGWVTADTHVHFLSPQTALLEGQAEGVNVVNLLASQWGEMFSNVTDFDGRTTLGAKEFGGDGEFLVRVGTENRMQTLGHISLLGYSGYMINPLCTGGPSESAVGDPQELSMAQWAQRCIDQGGLVVMPHAPNPQLERAADAVLGLINGMELMTFNPLTMSQINPYGLADWYRYLNLGYHIPLVGGSDKMAASMLLGGIRTYAHMGDLEFTYENWMAAVRAGNTFATVGPLVDLVVEGQNPGSIVELPGNGGTVNVTWKVESAAMPMTQVEIIVGGLVYEQINSDGTLSLTGSTEIRIERSTWVAVRVRGSYKNNPEEIAAHTSAVQVVVDSKELFSEPDAVAVLEQIEGSIAYVDTLAPRPDAVRFKQMRATLESAYNRLHQRMHQQGVMHGHSPVHSHEG
ncbi:MAG: CehA/McbA family metallohydrolase [Chloroflexota bacterium]